MPVRSLFLIALLLCSFGCTEDVTITESCPESVWYEDADGDGKGNPTVSISTCDTPDGYVSNAEDADDTCIERFWYQDLDGDGLGNLATVIEACTAPLGYVANGDDDVDMSREQVIGQYLVFSLDDLPNYANPLFPAYYQNLMDLDNTPPNNPISNQGASLGRVLFFDTRLSLNNTISCASCHSQETGFSDPNSFSQGFLGGETGAHSMRLANARFYEAEEMFWDRRAASLEVQSILPIQDAVEMGFTASVGGMDSLIRKMESLPYYAILFEEAFGSPEISENRMQRALAQYVRSMVSTNSRFDEGFARVYNPDRNDDGLNLPFPNFSELENMGKALYLRPTNQGGAGCQACHSAPTFTLDDNSRSNGLDVGETTIFKSPSLKNVAIGGPFMHDGRFATLTEVVEHYNSGIEIGPALDPRLRMGGPGAGPGGGQALQLNLSDTEKAALVAFLETLTDEVLLSDPRFSDPFRDR